MRTTVVLDDQLLREAKRRAAEQNVTLSAVLNQALRDGLRRSAPAPRGPKFSLPSFGGRSRLSHDPSDLKALVDDEDAG